VDDKWSPNITIGMPVLIPEEYVTDLHVRLALYRRLADITEDAELDAFGVELVDRFGPAPEEVTHLLRLSQIKTLARKANVEKVDAGPKGVVLAFRENQFADPAGLVQLINAEGPQAKVRPDFKVVFLRDWATAEARLKGTLQVLRKLAGLVEKRKVA
jgi:transcription-repair coupling factor (superfamily II helicase)